MPISTGAGGGLPGLSLKAWARVNAAGVLIKGVGIASVTRPATGQYAVTLSSAVVVEGTLRVLSLEAPFARGAVAAGATGAVVYTLAADGITLLNGAFFVEVYE